MRIFEIAGAKEQIELWKLVSNSVWQSLEVQQRSEQQRKAAEAAKAKPKASAKGKRIRAALPAPKPPAPVLPTTPQQLPAIGTASKAPPTTVSTKGGTQAAASAQPNTQQQQVGALSNPLKRATTAGNRPNLSGEKSDEKTDDRHSANAFSAARR